MEPRAPPSACDRCGAPSPSLLRCVRCKQAWYCGRKCQEQAWEGGDGREGHKSACRRLRRLLATANGGGPSATEAVSPSLTAVSHEDAKARKAVAELMAHVQSMDRGEAYRRMCLAEDEIKRLEAQLAQAELQQEAGANSREGGEVDGISGESKPVAVARGNGAARRDSGRKNGNNLQNRKAPRPANDTKDKTANARIIAAKGSWLDQGGRCSIEYLPNVACYQITLTIAEGDSGTTMPRSEDELHFDMERSDCPADIEQSTSVAHYKAKLRRKGDSDCLLSAILPVRCVDASPPIVSSRLSIDATATSIRIQLQSDISDPTDGSELADVLAGTEGSAFAPVTTGSAQLNRLRCRSCQKPILVPQSVENGGDVIRSVLPLPSGCWDEITDYLICYDGQANVDFSSSSTTAISGVALEDDAVLVLHRSDLSDGVRATRSKGYGEHSSELRNGTATATNDGGSLAWKDKSAAKGEGVRAVTCSKCCSTLGFVSDHDETTYRLYKHLLDCDTHGPSTFAKYTCGSFLAREMRRYAESEAVYTFIVGVSDENDWTRVHTPGEFILIRMLSWDTPMATLGRDQTKVCEDDDTPDNAIRFQKVVKVIFEVTSGRNELADPTSAEDPLEWSWRGNDFCCPPLSGTSADEASNADEGFDAMSRRKASSTRIFFSQREWSELSEALTNGTSYFSRVVSDAVVTAKLGPPSDDGGQAAAALSFLRLVA
ncbi:hypothetical protein ACHAXT_011813 [Thalassiosira profunda]